MNAAVWPRQSRRAGRLLHIDPARGSINDLQVGDLLSLVTAGDVLVLNDAATLPGSLSGITGGGASVEVRLANPGPSLSEWSAVLFGDGDWRKRTEDRPAPPVVAVGERLRFSEALTAIVVVVSPVSPRLVELRFEAEGAALLHQIYKLGRPVQYSYVAGPLSLRHVQTAFGSRPWAVEMPSAAWPLLPSMIGELRHREVGVASVTHAAGLSATGDPAIDELLPLPERYDVPGATVDAIGAARKAGGRVIAVGTTVVRAIEGAAAANGGVLAPGTGTTNLRLRARNPPRMVDGLLSGVHEPGASHFDLLAAFVPSELLERAQGHAEAAGYLAHEFGDSVLVLSRPNS